MLLNLVTMSMSSWDLQVTCHKKTNINIQIFTAAATVTGRFDHARIRSE